MKTKKVALALILLTILAVIATVVAAVAIENAKQTVVAAFALANAAENASEDTAATVTAANATAASAAPAVVGAGDSTAIKLKIDSPVMTVGGQEQPIDENGTVPVIQNGRTLLPVRAVVEAMGGSVTWDDSSRTAALSLGDNAIRLSVGSSTAYLNDAPQALDVAPVIIGGRTMLPIRFVAEGLGFDVGWDGESREVTISSQRPGGADDNASTAATTAPAVYFTSDISSKGLIAVYGALNWTPNGEVAVKISTGEPPNSNYLRVELIGDLVKSVKGAIVECNTAYGGRRASTAAHMQVAKDHGYADIAKVDIQDANGSLSIPVTGGTRLTEHFVGASFPDYGSYIVLSHFKGHQAAGFGGAIKNISIGMGSSEGKAWIHTAGRSKTNMGGGDQDAFLESMGEAGKAVADYLGNGKRIVYVNVMNRLSVDCDCDGNPAEPDMHDIGILASTDPVALDQACIDLVYSAKDSQSLIRRIESRNGLHTLEHAGEIGLGSREYKIVNID